MKKLDPIRLRYYGAGILPLSFIVIPLILMDIDNLNILYFTLGFWWNYAVSTPGVEVRIRNSRYKFSLLRLVLKINQFCRIRLANVKRAELFLILARAATPTAFILMLWGYSGQGNPLFGLAGAFLFECFIFLWNRLYKIPRKLI